MKNKALSNKKKNNVLSVGTENSMTSSTSDQVLQEGAGFLSFIFGSESSKYATKLILDSFEMNAPLVGLFVIKHAFDNNVKLNFGEQSETGRTILHWLVIFSAKIPFAKVLLFESLNISGISKYINKQDVAGNTVAHTAMYLSELNDADMDDVISLLIKKGVDLNIMNKDNKKIDLAEAVPEKEEKEETKEKEININQIFVRKSQPKEISDSEAARIAKKIAENWKVIKTDEVTSDTINFNRDTVEESVSKFTNGVDKIRKDTQNVLAKSTARIIKALSDSDPDEIKMAAKDAKDAVEKRDEKKPINFGGKLNNRNGIESDTIDSAQLVNELLENFNKKSSLSKITQNFKNQNKKQMGGLHKNTSSIIGMRRRIKNNDNVTMSGGDTPEKSENSESKFKKFYEKVEELAEKDSSDISMVSSSLNDGDIQIVRDFDNEDDNEDSETSVDSDNSSEGTTVSSDGGFLDKDSDDVAEQYGLKKLGRFNNPEATKRHDEAVKRIQKIMNVDESTAKAYKSMLYKKIKDENKEMDNDEISKELEKRSVDEKGLKAFVNSLNKDEVKKLKEIIEKKASEKKDDKKDDKKDKKEKKESKDTKEKKLSKFLNELTDDSDFESESNAYTTENSD